MGILITIDEKIRDKEFGHYACILVVINLEDALPNLILVEWEAFAFFFFFVLVEYEKILDFFRYCCHIFHVVGSYKKMQSEEARENKEQIDPKLTGKGQVSKK